MIATDLKKQKMSLKDIKEPGILNFAHIFFKYSYSKNYLFFINIIFIISI